MHDAAGPPGSPVSPSIDRALLTELSLARGILHRSDSLRSDEQRLAQVWADPRTRVLVVRDGLAPVTAGAVARLHTVSPAEAPDGERLLLGVDPDGVAQVMVRPERSPATGQPADAWPPVDPALPDGVAWTGLREVGAELSDNDAAILVTAVALDNWHAAHPRCPRCGSPTRIAHAGWVRRCVEDGSDHYPRTDPAVIVLVIDDADRALLGRQGRWPAGWFSTLAGFVEPGESAEEAVRREVAEESGVVVGEVVYLGSQPWPFPCSLMLGYHARATSTDVEVDGVEIVEARWFGRDDLAAACRSGEVALPPHVSIARRLVERWFGEPIPGDWSMVRDARPGVPR